MKQHLSSKLSKGYPERMARTTKKTSQRRQESTVAAKGPKYQSMLLALSLLVGIGAVVWVLLFRGGESRPFESPPAAPARMAQNPINGQRAYQFLTQICNLGPRISGSRGMQQQQQLLAAHFQELGAVVEAQRWKERHPNDGSPVEMVNMIVRWHPDRNERILLCAHYDTRPYPDQDPNPRKRRDPFIGANDGASGVAALAELGYHMSAVENVGVDFVFFDAEEFIFQPDRDKYFLGSERFARDLVASPPAHQYRYAVLLDMIGDANLQIFQERNSITWRDSAPLVYDIWRTARELGVREFIDRPRHRVRDDHLALHDIAGIPSCDIIDFDYPRPTIRGGGAYWHTTMDTADKCSAESLAKVSWVVLEWLKRQK